MSGGGPVTVQNQDFGGGPFNYSPTMTDTMGAGAAAFKVLGDIQVIGSMVGFRMGITPPSNTAVPKPMRIFMSLQVALR